MERNNRITSAYWALRIAFGLVPILAGLDKYLNLLTDWEKYVSPLAMKVMPLNATTLMHLVGVVEIAVGVAVLTRWTRLGSYVAAVWLVCIALNLLSAGYLDVALRDVVMAIAAYTLGKLTELRAEQEVTAVLAHSPSVA
jgi:uncharacterized membrane protein YphA (DoxX/SURF4 family)